MAGSVNRPALGQGLAACFSKIRRVCGFQSRRTHPLLDLQAVHLCFLRWILLGKPEIKAQISLKAQVFEW
jgi:hypothetical protein